MDELNCAHPRRWCPGFDGLYQGNVCADYPEEARRTAKKKKKKERKTQSGGHVIMMHRISCHHCEPVSAGHL